MLRQRSPQKILAACALFTAVIIAAVGLFCALPLQRAYAASAKTTVHVKITIVEIKTRSVRNLSVNVPGRNRFRNDLAALENAARRVHVPYVATSGPVLTATAGKPAMKNGVTVTALSVSAAHRRAVVRIRDAQKIESAVRSGRYRRPNVSVSATRRRFRMRNVPHASRRITTFTRVVIASRLYHSGETRLIGAMNIRNGRYRYVFATVTVQ